MMDVNNFSMYTIKANYMMVFKSKNKYCFLLRKATMNTLKPLLTIKTAAIYLNISQTTIRKWVHCPDFPSCKIGKSWRIPPEQLEKWINKKISTKELDGLL